MGNLKRGWAIRGWEDRKLSNKRVGKGGDGQWETGEG